MPPLAAGAHEVKQTIQQLSHVRGPRPSTGLGGRDERLQQAELIVRQCLAGAKVSNQRAISRRPHGGLQAGNHLKRCPIVQDQPVKPASSPLCKRALSAEDDPADTIRPRLDAAGADLERCHMIGAVREADGRVRGFSIANDLARLEAALAEIADPALVIIDPITAYLGGTDSYKNADVRAVLAPLADLAARVGAAVVAVSHLRKSNEGAAILSVSGSLAFVAAARAAYLVIRDREAVGRNLLLPAKNNLGDDKTGIRLPDRGCRAARRDHNLARCLGT